MHTHIARTIAITFAFFINAPFCYAQGQVKRTGASTSKITKTQGSGAYDNVSCSMQDRSGYIWFGTSKEGLYRYDGKLFQNFTTRDGLTSNTICGIMQDKKGDVWFATGAGICRYDGKTFADVPIVTGSNAYLFSGQPLGSQKKIWSIFQDDKGGIWLGTYDDGVYRYDGRTFTHFLHDDGVENKNNLRLNTVRSIIEDKRGNIWFSTWFEGICRYDGKAVTNFKPNNEVWYATLFEDKQGNIWAGRRTNGVCRYDGETFSNIMQHGMFDSCGVDEMVQDRDGNMWFAVEHGDMNKREALGGVWRYDGKTFTNFTTKDGLSNNSVFSAMMDRKGILWFGTRGTGLCSFDGKTFTDHTDR